MLTPAETDSVWRHMVEAEVRSLYFGELASKYSLRKQVITFASFFLASGSAATLVAKMPSEYAIALSIIAALATSYSLALGLDRKALIMSKLHAQWMYIANEYQHLWHHHYEEAAQLTFSDILARGAQASETAALEAPYNKNRLDHWADHGYSQYQQTPA